MKYKVNIILILFLINNYSFSQTKMIYKENAIQDIDSLHKYIEEIHPNAYAYVSKDEIDNIYTNIKKQINDSLSIYQFYNLLTYIAASYKDGHTSVIIPRVWYEENHKIIPFTIDIKDDKLFVNKSYLPVKIPQDIEIIEINDISAKNIIDTMINTQSGEAINFRIEKVKYFFPFLLYSIHNFDNNYKIKCRINNEIKILKIKGISYKQYSTLREDNNKNNYNYSARFLLNKSVCVIDFRSFTNLSEFKVFLDSTFFKIKKQNIKNLIIDLRNNTGGNSVLGDELFQYIYNAPFSQYDKTILKVSKQLKLLWKYNYLPNGVYDSLTVAKLLTLKNGVIVRTDTIFEENEGNNLIPIRKEPNRFTGNTYLLISHFTFSSAADFAWCFKHYNMGKIIGEETGGWGLCYGDNVYTELPNSNIAINVSCKLFYNIGANKESTHGVYPDYPVKSDDALEYALKLIDKK